MFAHVRAATEEIVDIPHPQVIRLPVVKEKTGLGTTSIYKGVKEGWFPKPIRLVGRTVGWLAREIDEWIAQRIEASRQPAA